VLDETELREVLRASLVPPQLVLIVEHALFEEEWAAHDAPLSIVIKTERSAEIFPGRDDLAFGAALLSACSPTRIGA
jgi:hypothetical protein